MVFQHFFSFFLFLFCWLMKWTTRHMNCFHVTNRIKIEKPSFTYGYFVSEPHPNITFIMIIIIKFSIHLWVLWTQNSNLCACLMRNEETKETKNDHKNALNWKQLPIFRAFGEMNWSTNKNCFYFYRKVLSYYNFYLFSFFKLSLNTMIINVFPALSQ